MDWTNTTPTEAGFYWMRLDKDTEPSVVELADFLPDRILIFLPGGEVGVRPDPGMLWWPQRLTAPPF